MNQHLECQSKQQIDSIQSGLATVEMRLMEFRDTKQELLVMKHNHELVNAKLEAKIDKMIALLEEWKKGNESRLLQIEEPLKEHLKDSEKRILENDRNSEFRKSATVILVGLFVSSAGLVVKAIADLIKGGG